MNEELYDFIEKNKGYTWKPSIPLPNNLWESEWPWAPVSNKLDTDACLNEMKTIDHLFVAHRDKDKISSYGHEGWNSITLHGISYDKTENYDRYGYKTQEDANYNWTSICPLIPKTVELIKSFPFTNYGRVRIMRLSPKGYIMPHVDGPNRVFGPFNFAINNPDGCRFVFEKYGVVPFKSGSGFMLDIGIKHCVYNDSNEYRYHIIIHGRPTADMQKTITESILTL